MAVPSPSRRSTLQIIAGAFLGVTAYLRRPHWSGFFGGYLKAEPLEPLLEPDEYDQLPPDEFITPHDDDRLADLAPLRAAMQRPGQRVAVSRREFGTAFDVFERLPEFDPYRHEGHDHPAVPPGIYVRDEDYTYWVQLLPKCSDTWWMETSGTPTGRNQCYRE